MRKALMFSGSSSDFHPKMRMGYRNLIKKDFARQTNRCDCLLRTRSNVYLSLSVGHSTFNLDASVTIDLSFHSKSIRDSNRFPTVQQAVVLADLLGPP